MKPAVGGLSLLLLATSCFSEERRELKKHVMIRLVHFFPHFPHTVGQVICFLLCLLAGKGKKNKGSVCGAYAQSTKDDKIKGKKFTKSKIWLVCWQEMTEGWEEEVERKFERNMSLGQSLRQELVV